MRKNKSKTIPRLFVSGKLAKSAEILLEQKQSHYLRSVMRLNAGDRVSAFNGIDGEWTCLVARSNKKAVTLICETQDKLQSGQNDLWYFFAPLKHARLDYIVQKATEMGASFLQPVKTEYTQTSRLKEERMVANAREAAEQCGLLTVPEIGSLTSLNKLLQNWPANRVLIFCNETEESVTPIDQLAKLKNKPLAVLIGPEGGFSQEEITLLNSYDFVCSISLGPRILRADTAGIAALAVIQATIGDW